MVETKVNQDYALLVSASTLHMANLLLEKQKDKERREKMKEVVGMKYDLLKEAFPEGMLQVVSPWGVYKVIELLSPKEQDERKKLVVDLAFINPFSPYEIKYGESEFNDALSVVGKLLGLKEVAIKEIVSSKKEAIKAHRNIDVGKVLLYGVAGIVVLGLGGYFLGPVVGTALGSAAGLSGAAATAHGLALLGGGSLAMGGAGMAGGLYLVTGIAAATGAATLGGGAFLLQMGAAGAKVELMKLQVSYQVIILDGQMHTMKAQAAIKNLEAQRKVIEKQLEEEKRLNEKNSSRIKDIEETLLAVKNATEWMRKKAGSNQ